MYIYIYFVLKDTIYTSNKYVDWASKYYNFIQHLDLPGKQGQVLLCRLGSCGNVAVLEATISIPSMGRTVYFPTNQPNVGKYTVRPMDGMGYDYRSYNR